MEEFIDYSLLEKINENRSFIIYKGQIENDNHSYIIKRLKTRKPSSSEIARFNREYALIRALDIDGIVRVVDIIDKNNYAIIEEDFTGIPLGEVIKKRKLTTESFLKMAIKLSETLGILHRNNIIHMAIKPENILVSEDQSEVKITNFGISSMLTHENDEIYDPEVIKQTLPYMSPEQTGRTNQRIDYRTDLYSLGITFYEMLTGTIPFKSNDPMELIYSHIARTPGSVDSIDHSIPSVISEIILKLLAKTPEDRYQNSFGLMIDLEKCLMRLKNAGRIEPFPLGEKDISIKFNIPQKLVGRKKETEALISIFQQVSDGKRQISLISGAPGIGKTAIINEVQQPIIAKRGYFISGKYDLFRRDVPYSAIIQAFQGLIRQLLTESEERINQWKELIQRAIGSNGKIITDIIPVVELIIGKQPDVPDLDPEQSQFRFNLVFKSFASVFATREHPLVLFLDDLQWADLASMAFIKTIVSDTKYLFFIGAFRDNEISTVHPFTKTIEEIKKEGVVINTLTISPLSVIHINQLLANFLRCTKERSLPLAQIVFEKTNGNPFFVSQFVKTLYNEGILTLNSVAGWTWDIYSIEKLQVTENVVDLMAENIAKLSQNTQEILKVGACIGNRFDIDTIAYIIDESIDETLNRLSSAIDEGLISQFGDMYRFSHDRIQEAAYSLISKNDKEKLHYRIGNFILEKSKDDELNDNILYIVNHINRASGLCINWDEQNNFARLNLMAGRKAKAAAAYESALIYYKAGIALLMKNCWNTQYDLALSLYEETAEAEYFCTHFDKIEFYAEVIKRNAKNLYDKININITEIRSLISLNNSFEAVHRALNILKLLNIKIPINPNKINIVSMFLKIKLKLFGKKIDDLTKMKDKSYLKHIAQGELLSIAGAPAYNCSPELFVLIVLNGVYLGIQHASTPLVAYGYAGYGAILCSVLGDIDSGYEFGELALKLIQLPGSEKVKVRTLFTVNFLIMHWKKHLRSTIQPLQDACQIGLETGDLEFAAIAAQTHLLNCFLTGYRLADVKHEMKLSNEIVIKVKQEIYSNSFNLISQVVLNLLNGVVHPYTIIGEAYDETKMLSIYKNEKVKTPIFNLYLFKFILFYLFGKFQDAIEYIEMARNYLDSEHGGYVITLFYFYDSLSSLAIVSHLEKSKKKKILLKIYKNQKKMKKWAHHAPTNHLHKYNLVEAEIARVKGDDRAAIDYYNKAICDAHDNEYLQDEALAYELAAMYYFSRNKKKIAGTFMTEAYNCYRIWGASAKVKQLAENYSELLVRTAIPSKRTYKIETFDSEEYLDNKVALGCLGTQTLDLSTLIKTSLAISGEMNLGRLLEIVMKLIIENAGAQKGFLILEKEEDEDLYIEAESTDRMAIELMKSIPVEKSNKLSVAIVNYVKKTNEPLILNDVIKEGFFTHDPYIIKNKPKSILCTPIQSKGKTIGILYLENNLVPHVFVSERIEFLKVLSSQAAISIENAILYKRAINDGLTGIYNKTFFDNYLIKVFDDARENKRPLSLLMIDVDHFKKYNDTYGHQFGDVVIKGVAAIITKTVQKNNLIARYGGEEFVVVLIDTEKDNALIIAEKIRKNIADYKFEYVNGKGVNQITVTVSIGISELSENISRIELIESADRKLYEAKANGRNKVL